jgi:hypothetical protein
VASEGEGITSNTAQATIQIVDRHLFGAVTHDPNSPGGEIYQIYDGVLGRGPDQVGFEDWTGALQGGESLHDIMHGFLSSPEFTSDFGDYTQLSDQAFVQDLYQTALDRQPEPQGLQGWQTALANGESREDVALGIVLSPEHAQDLQSVFTDGVFVPSASDDAIARLYYGLLDRSPDAAGLQGWENAAAQGLSVRTIAQDFIGSPEYQHLHGTQTDQQFVDALYQGALGRAPDAAGEQGWLNGLSLGTSRPDVALGIAESSEAQLHLAANIENGFKLI